MKNLIFRKLGRMKFQISTHDFLFDLPLVYPFHNLIPDIFFVHGYISVGRLISKRNAFGYDILHWEEFQQRLLNSVAVLIEYQKTLPYFFYPTYTKEEGLQHTERKNREPQQLEFGGQDRPY